MAVHRMDFLVSQHQDALIREARDQRLARESRQAAPRADAEAGRSNLVAVQAALSLARHDLRTHHLHRHHLGHA